MTTGIPDTMTVIEIVEPGEPSALQPAERPMPQPGAGEVLIAVAAAGVNYPDVMQRKGGYPPPPGVTDIPGLELSGTVVACGPDVAWPAVGDKVCALVAGGAYASHCVAPAVQCLPLPAGLSEVEAAALPETFFTVWTNFFDGGRLQRGESVLIHGGGGGIGTTAIQIAREWGCRIFATAGSDAKCRACEALGAERGINYREEDFAAVVKEATGSGVDVILDIVGAEYLARNLDCLAPGGRLVLIAVLGGAKAELFLPSLMRKRQTITGSTLRPRSVAEKGMIAEALRAQVWPLIEAGRVKPQIHTTLPLAQASEAHALMERAGHTGKIVLTV